MSTCRSCNAKIEWMKTEAGKNMPVDPEPIEWDELELGDVAINTHGRTRKKNEHMTESGKWYVSHFATCPDAREHKR